MVTSVWFLKPNSDGTQDMAYPLGDRPDVPGDVVPAPVTDLVATATGQYTIDLSWTAVPGATEYRIQRSPDNAIWSDTGVSYTNSYTSTALQQSSSYWYRIFSANAAGWGSVSNTATATTWGSGSGTTDLTKIRWFANFDNIADGTVLGDSNEFGIRSANQGVVSSDNLLGDHKAVKEVLAGDGSAITGTGFSRLFTDIPFGEQDTEIWMRVFVYHDTGFTWETDAGARRWFSNRESAPDASYAGGAADFMIVAPSNTSKGDDGGVYFSRESVLDGPNDGTWPIDFAGNYAPTTGSWECYEVYIKSSSSPLGGAVKYWQEGVLAGEQTGVRTRWQAENALNEAILLGTWGPGLNETVTYYWTLPAVALRNSVRDDTSHMARDAANFPIIGTAQGTDTQEPVAPDPEYAARNRTVTADATGSGDGSVGSPWTLQQAMLNAVAGDVVGIEAGVYVGTAQTSTADRKRYTPAFYPRNSGTASNPIVFVAEYPASTNQSNYTDIRSGGTQDGTGVNVGGWPAFGTLVSSYTHWVGIYSSGMDSNNKWTYDAAPCSMWSNTGNRALKCRLIGNPADYNDGSRNYSGIRSENNTDNVYADNVIQDFYSGGKTNSSGVIFYMSKNVLVEHNTITGCTHGLQPKRGWSYNTQYGVFRYNRIVGCNHAFRFHAFGTEGKTPLVHNNLMIGCKYFFELTSSSSDQFLQNVKFYSNTFVDGNEQGGGSLLWSWWNNPPQNNQFYNNIHTGSGAFTGSFNFTAAQIDSFCANSYNCITNSQYMQNPDNHTLASWQSAYPAQELNSISSAPLFVDANADDYRLSGGACTTASNTGGPVGCYITGDEVIGVRTNDAPVNPPQTGSYTAMLTAESDTDTWSWARTGTSIVSAENGVTPFDGTKMYKCVCPPNPTEQGWQIWGMDHHFPSPLYKGDTGHIQFSMYWPIGSNWTANTALKLARFAGYRADGVTPQGHIDMYIEPSVSHYKPYDFADQADNARTWTDSSVNGAISVRTEISPTCNWTLYEGGYDGSYSWSTEENIIKVDYGTWETFEFEVVVDELASNNGGVGHIKCWRLINGEMTLLFTLPRKTLLEAGGQIYKMMIFGGVWNDTTNDPWPKVEQTCYIDEVYVESNMTNLTNTDAYGNKIMWKNP